MTKPFDPKKPPMTLADLFSQTKRPESPVTQALMEALLMNKGGLKGPLNPFGTPTPLTQGRGGLFGLRSPPALGLGLSYNALADIGKPAPASGTYGIFQPKQRHVFYSFHYADIFRVNHVRNSGKIRAGDKGRNLTPRDRSLWEKVKRVNPAALKRVINVGLGGTSVTCVLAGYETWSREWVRYEIAQSLVRGNGLLTVYIDGCRCPKDGYGLRGENPLAYMAVGWDYRIYEYRNGGWWLYDKISTKLESWPKWLKVPIHGHVTPLSRNAPAYDWIADSGSRFLIRWANQAAIAAGR